MYINCDGGRGFVSDPTGGAYSAPKRPPICIKGIRFVAEKKWYNDSTEQEGREGGWRDRGRDTDEREDIAPSCKNFCGPHKLNVALSYHNDMMVVIRRFNDTLAKYYTISWNQSCSRIQKVNQSNQCPTVSVIDSVSLALGLCVLNNSVFY